MTSGVLQRARESFDRRVWPDAVTQLHAADTEGVLEPEDLERLAVASGLSGDLSESDRTWERAHKAWLEVGDLPRAARTAFWLGMHLAMRGEHARGGGWLARAARLIEEYAHDCAELGYLHLPDAMGDLARGRIGEATIRYEHACRIGERFADSDLLAMARMGVGQCLLARGEIVGGMALLDEVLVSVVSGETSPIPTGIVCCAVILECQARFDLRRAQDWTEALDEWSRSQRGLVPFRGQCLVHRAELMRLRGRWSEAEELADQAERLLNTPRPHPVLGMALYERAELHRLRGEFAEAERAYRSAGERGRDPQPGLALLRLTQGRVEAAHGSIRRVLDEAHNSRSRCMLLPASAEIALAAGNVASARATADELSAVAAELDKPLVHAVSDQLAGAVRLAEGDPAGAGEQLRRSLALWQELDAPHEVARVRVLIGQACRELGDADSSELEFDIAERAFRELGAAPELARLQALRGPAPTAAPSTLTAREAEVLALAAAGRTNREIAAELVLSEHTVRRHLQNVFAKLDVPSRAAATSYALRHGLI